MGREPKCVPSPAAQGGLVAHSSFMRQFYALCLRDLRQAFVNPVIVLYTFVPISLSVVLPIVAGVDIPEVNAMSVGIVVSGILACPTTTPTAFALLEEWEHGTIQALVGSGVSPHALVLARLLTSIAITVPFVGLGFALISVFLPGVDSGIAPLLALASMPAAFIGSALTLGCSLAIRKQEHVYTCCGVTLLAFIVGMLQTMMAIPALELMPFGSIIAFMMHAVYGIEPLLGWPMVAGACIAWVFVASGVLAFGMRSFERVLGSERGVPGAR